MVDLKTTMCVTHIREKIMMTHIQCADFDQPMGITFLQVETYISCIQIMLALLMKSMICDTPMVKPRVPDKKKNSQIVKPAECLNNTILTTESSSK